MAYLVHGSGMAIAAVKSGDYRAFACVQQVVFRVESDILETSTLSTGPYRTYRPVGLTKWSISLNGVVYLRDQSTTKNFALETVTQQVRTDGYDVKITFTDEEGYINTITGFCYIPYTEIVGGAQNPFSKWSVELQGSGEFELNITPSTIICETVDTYRYTATGGETSFVDATLISRTALLGFRNTDEFKVITAGTPGNQELKYDSTTGTISWTTGYPADAGERFTFTYKS